MSDAAEPEAPRMRRAYWAFSLAMLAVTLVPFLSVELVPLLDLPNHLSRAYVLDHLHDVPLFEATYDAAWGVLPNLAMDLVLAPLVPLIGVFAASRTLMALVAIAWHFGVHVLARALHERRSWLAPLGGYFLFSSTFFLGFVNFTLGVAVFFYAFATWLRWWRRGGLPALVGASALAVVAYFCHLSALGVFGVAVVAWLVAHRHGTTPAHAALALIPLALPLLLYLRAPALAAPSDVVWSISETINSLQRFVRTYDPVADLLLFLGFFGPLALALGWSRRPVNRAALEVAAALFLTFIAAPHMFHRVWLAMRFLPPAAVLALVAFELDLARPRVRWALGAAAVAVIARVAFITATWVGLDATIQRYVALMEHIPEGSRVYAIAYDPLRGEPEYRALAHVQHYATITRHAVVSRIFAKPGEHPLQVRPSTPVLGREPSYGRSAADVDWGPIFARYDTVWLCGRDPSYPAFLDAHCAVRWPLDDVVIYRECTSR